MANPVYIWCILSNITNLNQSTSNPVNINGGHLSSTIFPSNEADMSSECTTQDMKMFANCLNCATLNIHKTDDKLTAECSRTNEETPPAGNISFNSCFTEFKASCSNCHAANVAQTESHSWPQTTVLITTVTSIAFLGNVGSITALTLLKKYFPGQFKLFHVFLLNLAVSNALMSLCDLLAFVMALVCKWTVSCALPFDTVVICMHVFLSLLTDFFVVSTIAANFLIVLNQYVGVEWPFRHKQISTPFMIKVSLTVSWGFAFIVSGIMFELGFAITEHVDASEIRPALAAIIRMSFCHKLQMQIAGVISNKGHVSSLNCDIIISLTWFLLLVSIVAIYLRIQNIAKKSSSIKSTENQKVLKMNVTIALLAGSLIILWFPGILTKILEIHLFMSGATLSTILVYVSTINVYCRVINSLLDPLFYGARLQEVRKGYKALFGYYNK